MGEPKDDDPFADWSDAGGVADAPAEAQPLVSRTQTVADPLTTGLLAEVARRTTTMEFDPAMLEGRPTQEIDQEVLARALAEAEGEPRRKAK